MYHQMMWNVEFHVDSQPCVVKGQQGTLVPLRYKLLYAFILCLLPFLSHPPFHVVQPCFAM